MLSLSNDLNTKEWARNIDPKWLQRTGMELPFAVWRQKKHWLLSHLGFEQIWEILYGCSGSFVQVHFRSGEFLKVPKIIKVLYHALSFARADEKTDISNISFCWYFAGFVVRVYLQIRIAQIVSFHMLEK